MSGRSISCFALQAFFRELSLVVVCMPDFSASAKKIIGKPKATIYCAHFNNSGAKLQAFTGLLKNQSKYFNNISVNFSSSFFLFSFQPCSVVKTDA